jgi:hypothetical protein
MSPDIAGKIKFAALIVAIAAAWWWSPIVCPILITVGVVSLISLGVSKLWGPAAILGAGIALPYGAIALCAGIGILAGPPNPWLPGGTVPLPVYASVTDAQYAWASPRGAVIGVTIGILLSIAAYALLTKLVKRRLLIKRHVVPEIAAALIAQGRFDGYTAIDRVSGASYVGDVDVRHHPAPGTPVAGSPTEPDRRPRVPARPVPVPVADAWVDYAVDPAHLFAELQVALVDNAIEYQTPRKCLLRLRPADIPQVDQLLASLRAQAG